MDFEKIAAEFADGLSAGPIPEPAAEKVERAGRILASNGWNPNVAGEADFTAACREWARCTCVPKKGLFIHGGFGCGKTMLMDAIRRAVGGLWVNLANPDEAERLDAKLWPNWNADAMRRTVFLDDLGAESAASEGAAFPQRDAAPSAEPPSVRARPEARSPVRAGARKFASRKNHETP